MTEQGILPVPIQPGKPWQNGNNESFNGKFRGEWLSAEWFRSRREAKAIIEARRQDHSMVRPHSSIYYMTPNEYRSTIDQPNYLRPIFQ